MPQGDLKDGVRLDFVEEFEFLVGVLVVLDHVDETLILVLTLFPGGFVHQQYF